MNKAQLKKLLILNLPYVLIGLYATKLGEAWRLAEGTDMSGKLLHLMDGFAAAFRSPWPSFVPADLLLGITLGCLLRLVVYEKAGMPRSTGTTLNMALPDGASPAIFSRSSTRTRGTT